MYVLGSLGSQIRQSPSLAWRIRESVADGFQLNWRRMGEKLPGQGELVCKGPVKGKNKMQECWEFWWEGSSRRWCQKSLEAGLWKPLWDMCKILDLSHSKWSAIRWFGTGITNTDVYGPRERWLFIHENACFFSMVIVRLMHLSLGAALWFRLGFSSFNFSFFFFFYLNYSSKIFSWAFAGELLSFPCKLAYGLCLTLIVLNENPSSFWNIFWFTGRNNCCVLFHLHCTHFYHKHRKTPFSQRKRRLK